MPDALQNGDRFRRAFVLFLVIGITAAFLWMIWPFVMTIVLAAIMLTLVAGEALRLSEAITPKIQELVAHPQDIPSMLERLPFYQHIAPYRGQIAARAAELLSNVGRFVVSSITATTAGTASAVLQFFILLYTLFFFLLDGPAMLRRM